MSVGSVLLWILAGILAVLLALLVLPVGVRVCYDVSGLRICLLAGPIRWQLLPAKSKWWFKRRTKDKPAPPARPAGKPAGKPKLAHKGGAWSNLKPYLPVFRNLLLGLRRRLLVRRLEFWVKLGGDDPCDLAIRYGRAWACLGALQPLLDRALRIRRKDVQVDCDFTAEDTEVDLRVDLVPCPARLLGLLLRQGPALLRIYEEQKIKKAV